MTQNHESALKALVSALDSLPAIALTTPLVNALEAAQGVLNPPNPNYKGAARAHAALFAYAKDLSGLSNLLGDLNHLADTLGVDYESAKSLATLNYVRDAMKNGKCTSEGWVRYLAQYKK